MIKVILISWLYVVFSFGDGWFISVVLSWSEDGIY